MKSYQTCAHVYTGHNSTLLPLIAPQICNWYFGGTLLSYSQFSCNLFVLLFIFLMLRFWWKKCILKHEKIVVVWIFGLVSSCSILSGSLSCVMLHCFLPLVLFPSFIIVMISFTCPWLASCVFSPEFSCSLCQFVFCFWCVLVFPVLMFLDVPVSLHTLVRSSFSFCISPRFSFEFFSAYFSQSLLHVFCILVIGCWTISLSLKLAFRTLTCLLYWVPSE